jgi:muramoyltetrapeptide carboxypeptidase LdcA involved in peptidoglycan recycling
VFDQIVGLVVGKVDELSAEEEHLLDQLLLAHTARYRFPVLAGVDFGHTDPRLTLPIDVQASLASKQELFTLDETAVV